eukprot:364035-Chlamydomonas_euryale.AAC.8
MDFQSAPFLRRAAQITAEWDPTARPTSCNMQYRWRWLQLLGFLRSVHPITGNDHRLPNHILSPCVDWPFTLCQHIIADL